MAVTKGSFSITRSSQSASRNRQRSFYDRRLMEKFHEEIYFPHNDTRREKHITVYKDQHPEEIEASLTLTRLAQMCKLPFAMLPWTRLDHL
jgi:hypothetical protein